MAIAAAHMLGGIEPPARQRSWNQRALELAQRSAGPRAQQWLGALYNNIGWTHHDQGQYDQALAVFQRGVVWREAQGQSRQLIIARWAVARTWRSLGLTVKALAVQRDLL